MTDAARPIPANIESAPALVVTPGGLAPASAAPLRVIRKDAGDHTPPTVDVTGSPAGRRNVYGLIACPAPGALSDYLGAPITLQLEDGATLPITISKVLGPHRYLVQALGRGSSRG